MPELMTRRAPLAHSTFNREARTVEAILSAGADVERRDARGGYTERLNVAGATVRDGGDRVPLLDSHRRDTIGAVLGYADAIRVAGGEVRATLHIADDRALALIDSGAVAATSIGYAATAEEWRQEGGRRIRSLTPVIHEASLTAFPADPNAAILRNDPVETPIENRAEANAQIRNLVRTAGLPGEFADGLIDRGATVDETRAAAFDELIRRRVHIPAVQIGASNDDPAAIIIRMADALAHRLGAPGELPAEAAPYRGMGIHDMSRILLAARGERVLSMPVEELLTRAIGTSDLPTLLQGSGQRTLMAAYQAAVSPVFQLARQTTATDFRTKTVVRLGEFQKLEKVAEHGEITHGGVAETAESYSLATYGKMFSLTRQALINDDLGAFATVSAAQGRAAAETQNDLIVKLLTQGNGLGPVMSDGNRLYHSSHGNVATAGAALSNAVAALSDAVLAMRRQKGVDGVTPINATGRYLLVSPENESAAQQTMAEFFPATASSVQPYRFSVLVEPRLTGTRWYIFADPATLPVLEYAYLASAPGPQMESRPGWEVLGIEFRVILDFGCGATDWRGTYSNAGA